MSDNPLKVIFAGTPDFARVCLERLLSSRHQVLAVYTQPDRAAGRGRKMRPGPVKEAALSAGLPVCQPVTLRDATEQSQLAALGADLMVVVAYGLLLPPPVLTAFPRGCINVHASLLPRWRGAAPIQHAILAGDRHTGVTIMQMDKGLDTGAMLSKAVCEISEQDTAASLHDRLAELGASLLLDSLDHLDELSPEPQDDSQACYAGKISKGDGAVDWHRDSADIDRRIRAFTPWPGAWTRLGEETMKILKAHPHAGNESAEPGTVVGLGRDGMDVATADGILRIERIQMPGGRPISIADFINARRTLQAGFKLSSPES